MARFWIRARTLTTTLTRSDTTTTLRDAGKAIRDYFKAGGTGDIGATAAFVQWVNGTTFEVIIERDDMASVSANLTTFRSDVRTGLLAVQLSGQAFITACTADDIDVIEQSSVAATTGASWAPAHTAAGAPGVNNDSADTAELGKTFGVGSLWIQTNGITWACRDATPGAAVWVRQQHATPGTNTENTVCPVSGATLIWLPYVGFTSQRYMEAMGTVEDQGGNNYDATQVTVNNRPLYNPGGGATRGCGTFDYGQSHHMAFASLAIPSSWTFFYVFRTKTSSAAGMYVFGWSNNGTAGAAILGVHMVFSGNSPGKLYYQFGHATQTSYGATTGAPIERGKWHCVTMKYTNGGTAPVIYVDDGSAEALTAGSTAAASSSGTVTPAVGRSGTYAGAYFDGEIAAVVGFPSALSDGDRVLVRDWLQGLFGL